MMKMARWVVLFDQVAGGADVTKIDEFYLLDVLAYRYFPISCCGCYPAESNVE